MSLSCHYHGTTISVILYRYKNSNHELLGRPPDLREPHRCRRLCILLSTARHTAVQQGHALVYIPWPRTLKMIVDQVSRGPTSHVLGTCPPSTCPQAHVPQAHVGTHIPKTKEHVPQAHVPEREPNHRERVRAQESRPHGSPRGATRDHRRPHRLDRQEYCSVY